MAVLGSSMQFRRVHRSRRLQPRNGLLCGTRATVTRSRSGMLWFSGISFGLGFLVLLLSLDASPLYLGRHSLGIGFEIASGALGIWLALILFWWFRHQRRVDVFELPVWFSLNAFGQVVLNIWALQPDVRLTPFVTSIMTESTPVVAILLMAVGISALWAGYLAATHLIRSQRHPVQRTHYKPRWRLIAGIWLFSTLLQAVSVAGGAVGYLPLTGSVWASYIAFVGYLGQLTTFMLLLQHFSHPRTIGWLWLFGMASTNILLGLIEGTKGAVLVLLYVVMAIYYARRRVSARWLAVGFLALVLTVPTVNTFRTNLYRAGFDRSTGAGLSDRMSVLLSSLGDTLSYPLSGLAVETRETFEQRQGTILEITISMLAVHPDLRPFVGLDMLSYLAQESIPRVFWPGKPAGTRDLYLIVSSYLGLPDFSLATPGQFADAYRVGGWPFAAIWLCLLGILMAWFYSHGPAIGDLTGTAFCLLMLTSCLDYEYHVALTTLELLKFGLPLWLISRFVLVEATDQSSPHVLADTVVDGSPQMRVG